MKNTPAMPDHEREFFVARIRSGIYFIEIDNFVFELKPPSIYDLFFINKSYTFGYEQAIEKDIKTWDEIQEYLSEVGIWTAEHDHKVEQLQEDVERFKISIFRDRLYDDKVNFARAAIRSGEKQLVRLLNIKNQYYSNSCEAFGEMARLEEMFRRCLYLNGRRYDVEDLSLSRLISEYQTQILSDTDIRCLARTEPWRSLWSLKEQTKLFENVELTVDQKNILIWSRMYDNVYENPECPSDKVVNDDDMLDGWFISQRKKREKERQESDFDSMTSNDRIKNSSEIFMVAKNKDEAKRIFDMNNTDGKIKQQQRIAVAKHRGQVSAGQFPDERVQLNAIANQQFKGKFKK